MVKYLFFLTLVINYVKCTPCSFCLSNKIVTVHMNPVNKLEEVYFEGDTVEFKCVLGFSSYGKKLTTTCTKNKWTPFTTTCKAKLCSRPIEPENGYINNYEGCKFGDIISYACNDGFILIGYSTNKCIVTSDNKLNWEHKTPLCVRSFCKPPKHIENGYYTPQQEEYIENSVVTYICENKYTLVGHKQNVCQNAKWLYNSPMCKIVKCPYPYINNGIINTPGTKFTLNDKITYFCKNGYTSNSKYTSSICNENNKWLPPLPTCL
ncbi:Secreted complement binding protein C3b/C4b [Eptesipox virus]|uniref:Secreted complement binding protein C3b/C4b n=1 Tax=Eptesipox virus TaxID=1329402 RepID=A0A220T6P1_9POXV|nr:Secreted complement binding protein C3b/C4b [Eptesipox virus]ASK51375.1 Secreted complement binding protein C3b/C4b [Eptesipox virus]WAH71133.1 secreted complement binding protein C3b/C4b [Eptesipox virus]